jgi:4-hydroxy-3-methylbut-2-en-1-yl diphosphate reductase
MKILLANSAGFCFGVKRATNMAFEAATDHPRLCSLGPIIHSPQLVEKLEEQGVKVVEKVEDLPEGAVIIRSHGITAEELAKIEQRPLEVIDATCPFVKKAQEHAARLSREGYHLVLVGEAEHPEVQGIVSYAKSGSVSIVAGPEEAEKISKYARIGVVAQTTQSLENFQQIVAVCLRKAKEVRVFNTICDATFVRQNEARSLAREVDLMLVIGGYNSANTSRLATICRDLQPQTHHIETAEDLDPTWFAAIELVGITAGASTPAWLIDQVVARIKEIDSRAGK